MIDIVLFDFDQTLVNSRHLSWLRDHGSWDAVSGQIGTLQLYPGVREAWDYLLAEQIKIGIVSNSPRDTYLIPACAHLGLVPDVIIGFHDVTRRKPNPEPYLAAIAVLGGRNYLDPAAQTAAMKAAGPYYRFLRGLGVYPDHILVIGDTSNDIIAADPLYVSTVAALWGADDRDELLLAQPSYACETAAELQPLIEDLKHRTRFDKRGEAYAARARNEYASRLQGWTQLDTTATGRPFLRQGEEVYFLRRHRPGGWSACHTNGLISGFKKEDRTPAALAFKQRAADQFATELASFMVQGARFLFVPQSKKRDHAEFDPRNDMVVAKLRQLRPDLNHVEPISLLESRQKASGSEDPALRDPDNIIANYSWNGEGWQDSGTLYVIDDVLTKGGHMKATGKFVLENGGPVARVIGLSWTLHG